LQSAVQGKGKTVFISGEAGTGKTRLITEFLDRSKEGVAILYGWCLSDGAVPYFPFIRAFDAYFSASQEDDLTLIQDQSISLLHTNVGLGDVDRLGVSAWLTGTKPAGTLGNAERLLPQLWKDQVFDAVSKTLHTISSDSPTILFLEDIHWADSGSLALLHFISRIISSERVLIIATFRSDELSADSEGRPHPLTETIRVMRREDLFREIKLTNLNQNDVTALAENMLGGSVQPELLKKLAAESQGNALFVVESLRMLFERRSLFQENDRWRLAIDELGIPAKIKDVILRRLSILKYNQRRVLDAASVIGEKFDVELLSSVLGQDSLETLEILNTIARSTSLIRVDGNYYRFDHAKSRETLYEEIQTPLKKGYHARVAERIESSSKSGKPSLSDLAYHFAQAGIQEKAVRYSLDAGQDALSRFSNTEAIKHFEYILKTLGETQNHNFEVVKALEGLGDAFYANSIFIQARKTYEHLSDIGVGIVKLRALRKAMDASFFSRDDSDFTEYLTRAEQYTPLDRLESARVLMNKGRLFAHKNMPARVVEEQEKALEIFLEENSLWDAAWALIGIGFQSNSLGEQEKGLSSLLRSVALFEEVGDFRGQMEANLWAGITFAICGLEREAIASLLKVIEIDEKQKIGDYMRLGEAYGWQSLVFEVPGDFTSALSMRLKGLQYVEKTDRISSKASYFAALSRIYARLNNVDQAEAYFSKLAKYPPEILTSPNVLYRLTKAIFLTGENQFDESTRFFKEVLESNKLPASTIYFAKTSFAWSLERQGRLEEAREQMEGAKRILEKADKGFENISVQATLMAPTKIEVGKPFELRLDFTNISKTSGFLTRIENLIIPELKVIKLPGESTIQGNSVNFTGKTLEPFKVTTLKLTLSATKTGLFQLAPEAVYTDANGETKTTKPKPVSITAQHPAGQEIAPGRISSGFSDLDRLLQGGIPEKYSIILSSPSSDETDLIVRRFLEFGATEGETTFHMTSEASYAAELAKTFPSDFYLLICSPQADLMVQGAPNIFKLKGIENLTEIEIVLTKLFRSIPQSQTGPRRACISLLSDVLLQHHSIATRRWLGSVLSALKSKGFTTLAVINPEMHPPEEVQAIIGLFDGEIRVSERETEKGSEKVLRIRKMYNQRYLDNEITLTREKLE
jgi:tetratricopeptide (TPR) repeat protein/KaiC/GvpD/RAD55 family RecA-like ATPase